MLSIRINDFKYSSTDECAGQRVPLGYTQPVDDDKLWDFRFSWCPTRISEYRDIISEGSVNGMDGLRVCIPNVDL
jgi:hypothetical protein